MKFATRKFSYTAFCFQFPTSVMRLALFTILLLSTHTSTVTAESSSGGGGSDTGGYGLCGFFSEYGDLLVGGGGTIVSVTVRSEKWLSYRGPFEPFQTQSDALSQFCLFNNVYHVMLHLEITIIDADGNEQVVHLRLHAGDGETGSLCPMPYHYPKKKIIPISDPTEYPIMEAPYNGLIDPSAPIVAQGETRPGEFLERLYGLYEAYCNGACQLGYSPNGHNCGFFIIDVLFQLGLNIEDYFPIDENDCSIYAFEFNECRNLLEDTHEVDVHKLVY